MNEETWCGDWIYVNNVWISLFNSLRWSRKRRKKWLRRNGFTLREKPEPALCDL